MILIDEYTIVNKGLKLDNNQDNIYLNGIILPEINEGYNEIKKKTSKSHNELIYAVFDGIGGLDKGEHASFVAASSLKKYRNKKSIDEIINIINKSIYDYNNKNNIDMGTTCSIISIKDNKLVIRQIGDSPIYILSKNTFTKVKAKKKNKKLLENYLGNNLDINMSIKKIKIKHNDKIIICSDGLSLDDVEIEYLLTASNDVKYIAEKLVNYSLMNNGNDNTTITVLKVRNNITLELVLISLFALISIIAIYYL